MNKINLITHESDLTSFNADYLKPILEKYFNIVYYTGTEKFDTSNSVIVKSAYRNTDWYTNLQHQGIKTVVENLWEQSKLNITLEELKLSNKNWFWYNESLWYQWLGYDQYYPNKKYTHRAFMPMRLKRNERDLLLQSMAPYLDQFIYSYVAEGKYLPNDLPHDLNNPGGTFQRYFNSDWYDATYFSIVAESTVEPGDLFISEKLFKPLAFYHPMIIFGQPGILKHIKSLGYETFDNLFNESYDEKDDLNERLQIIVENVKNFNYMEYDRITWGKLEHNRNLFFNKGLIEMKIINEIINPIIEYCEKI